MYMRCLMDLLIARCKVWDDKNHLSMFGEVFEGGGCLWIMTIKLQEMAHSYAIECGNNDYLAWTINTKKL
jgi:hypothetical protein